MASLLTQLNVSAPMQATPFFWVTTMVDMIGRNDEGLKSE
jgi:hypothetical protein